MGLSVSIERNIRVLSFSGPITNESLKTDMQAFWRSSDYDDSLNELYDLRGVEISQLLDSSGLAAIGRLNQDINREAPPVKVAILVNSKLAYGLSRQLMPYLGDRYEDERIQLFEDHETAVDGLSD